MRKSIMKKYIHRSFLLLTLIVFLFVLMIPCVDYATATQSEAIEIRTYRTISDEEYYPDDYTGYIYPVRPGTPEWAALSDHEAMVRACEIPEDILSIMSTEALVQSVLAYPLISDMFAYDDWSQGLEIVASHFNGLENLGNRQDNASCVVRRYFELAEFGLDESYHESIAGLNASSNSIAHDISYETSRNVLYSMVIGVLLTDEAYSARMQESDYAVLGAASEALLITNDSPLINCAESDIVAETTSAWTYQYRAGYTWAHANPVYLAGPNGVSVLAYTNVCYEVWLCSDGVLRVRTDYVYADLPTAYKTTLNEQHYDVYGLTPIAQPTVKYNCHSYAWYMQSTSNPYWIDNINPYLNSGNYSPIDQMSTAVGDRVVYYYSYGGLYQNPSHSAVITSFTNVSSSKRNFTLTSKWGMSGLYSHSLSNCPYYYGTSDDGLTNYLLDYRFYG